MQKRQNILITVLTLLVVAVLSFYVITTIQQVNAAVTASCFDALTEADRTLARELYETSDMDRTVLRAMAALLAAQDEASDAEICSVLQSYDSDASYLTYVELLRPDNTMLNANGTIRDVTGSFDFAADAARGEYISQVARSTLDPEERVVRNAVPVKQGEETIAILYGVIRLSELAKQYTTDIYNGTAYVYLLDGDSGDFLLDTWHNSYGNIRDVSNRTMLPGYSFETAIADMAAGRSGNIGFISHTTGQTLLMHYEPVGINNWCVVITVADEYALRESRTVRVLLYRMAAVIAGVMLLYILSVSLCLYMAYRQVRRIATEDPTTGLLNRTAYERYAAANATHRYAAITCVYIDANGLHEINNQYGHAAGDHMLRAIANSLKKEFTALHATGIYRIGGDEFVVLCENADESACAGAMRRTEAEIGVHGYCVSYGIVRCTDEIGLVRVTQEADERMLAHKRDYYATHERRR